MIFVTVVFVQAAAMASQAAGNTYRPFAELMNLETINENTFRSTAQPFCPGGDHPRSIGRAYGGHVYAQAAWAAAQTVPEGFVLHVSILACIPRWALSNRVSRSPSPHTDHRDRTRPAGSYWQGYSPCRSSTKSTASGTDAHTAHAS